MKQFAAASTRLLSSRLFQLGVGIGVSIVCVYLAVQNVDYYGIWLALVQADVGLISLALLSVALNTVGKAARWQILMGVAGRTVAPLRILGMLVVGQMLNSVIPARVGDVSRAYVIGGMGPGRTFVLGTIALEKILDMTMYALLFLLLVLLMPVPAWLSQPAYLFAILTFSILLITLVVTYRSGWLLHACVWMTDKFPANLKTRLMAMIQSGLTSLHILHNHKNTMNVAGWCVVIWGTAVLTNYLVMRALNIDVPVVSALFVLIVLQAGISIPSVPGRIGVFEYLCILALSVFAIDSTIALSFGLLLHAIVFIPPTIAGVLFLWGSGWNIRQPPPSGSVDSELSTLPVLKGER